ncbi:MAG: DNA repair protein RadC [Burkholderiales bacterium]|jgi:DNA repair protein RadC|nr:DNA repair protein RadC [Burkholderiales bacterium]
MTISHWPEQERPRERLAALGAAALSDAELLAILLRTGVRGKSAVDLARDILVKLGGIRGLLNAPDHEWRSIAGLGAAKRAQVMAGIELARRLLREGLTERDAFNRPEQVREFLILSLAGLAHESFHALWLDNQNRLLVSEELFRGTLTEAHVYPREVVKRALTHNAAAVIFAHNHPSGHAEPSASDLTLTRRLAEALALIDVRVLDHFVIAGHEAVSVSGGRHRESEIRFDTGFLFSGVVISAKTEI